MKKSRSYVPGVRVLVSILPLFAGGFFGVLGMSILYRVKVPSLPASGKD